MDKGTCHCCGRWNEHRYLLKQYRLCAYCYHFTVAICDELLPDGDVLPWATDAGRSG